MNPVPPVTVLLMRTARSLASLPVQVNITEWPLPQLGERPLTGSDVEAILIRAKERAVLASRDNDVQLTDLEEAVNSFIDPLDPALLALQDRRTEMVKS